ncbi:MAG: DNA polymerase domain-containing protein [Gemmatimonadales bacterium]
MTARSRGKRPRLTLRRSRGAVSVVDQLRDIERDGGDGELDFGGRKRLRVSSLNKQYFATAGVSKGGLMAYYAAVANILLPIIKDRPLILKRYPEGVPGPSFFQQNAGSHVPPGVRTAIVSTADGAAKRFIGGDLITLLYTVQLGAIGVHTWQARIRTPSSADTATIDLDPADGLPFRDVVRVAKVIGTELDRLALHAAIKTSGSSGIHIALPLPARTGFDTGAELASLIAARVVDTIPELATLERSVRARPAGTVYVDAQQNSQGKSVVAAYSVRERPKATVSAPIEWRELTPSLRLESFSIETMPNRIRTKGDPWTAALRRHNSRQALERALRDA